MLRDHIPTTAVARLLLLAALGLLLAAAPIAASQTGLISTIGEPAERAGTTGSEPESRGHDEDGSESDHGTTAVEPARPPRVRGTEVITPPGTAPASGATSEVAPERPSRVRGTEVAAAPGTHIPESPATRAGGATGTTVVTGTASIASSQQTPSPPAAAPAPAPTPKTPTAGATSTVRDPEAPLPSGARSSLGDPEAPVPAGAGSTAPDPETPAPAGPATAPEPT